uniref:Uncharacterized protein n=1 Tax=Anguilla anguilla TaxID=7936 RepID=A0A0E9RVM4_ANGAN
MTAQSEQLTNHLWVQASSCCRGWRGPQITAGSLSGTGQLQQD